MTQEKYFHISDILSVHTGIPMSEMGELTMPDGTTRPAYQVRSEGIRAIAEHVMGTKFPPSFHPDREIHKRVLMEISIHVHTSLSRQLPWLEIYQPHLLVNTDREDSVQAILESAIENFGAWHRLSVDNDIRLSSTPQYGADNDGPVFH